MAGNPHDKLARSIFRDLAAARGFFAAVLPEAVLRHLDLRTLKRLPDSYIDESLRESLTDLVFEVVCAGRPALLYLLLEHLSGPRPMTPFRISGYNRQIWEDHLARHPAATTLPPVIPVVLFHGERPWSGPTRLKDLIDLPPEWGSDLDPWLPDHGFILVDLSAIPDARLRRVAVAGTAAALLALLLLKYSRRDGFRERLAGWGQLFQQVRAAPNGWSAIVRLITYVLKATDLSPQDLGRTLHPFVGPEAEEEIMSTWERLRLEGMAEGRSEGQTLGQTMDCRDKLLRLLRARFGAISGDVQSRIQSSDLEQLDLWFDRALTAADLTTVFAD